MPGSRRPLALPRWWGAIPLALCVLLFGLRACVHDAPFDRLTRVGSLPGDPPDSIAYTGSLYIARGGPVIVGYQASSRARLVLDGRDIRGPGTVVKERIHLARGPVAIRFAGPPDARLVWSPVGRRGDPEYVPASSLSPEPPQSATFDHAGAAPLDGAIALALLLVAAGTLLVLARHRLARVSRRTWIAIGAVFAVALVARLVGLGDMGATWDEDVNWSSGRNYVTNVLSLDFAESAWVWNYEHPPIMKVLAGIGAQFADGYGPARALSAGWSALACALLVPIGARLFQLRAPKDGRRGAVSFADLRVGVLAGLIAALLPPLVAHGQIVGHEAPTTLWWSLGILLALVAHDDLPETNPRRALVVRLAWIGVVIGIAIASRFVNGFLGPVCAAIVVLQAPRSQLRATLVHGGLVMPLVAVFTVYAVWPRLWLHPIANLELAFAKLSTPHGLEPFLGELTRDPGPGYFLLYLAAVAPLGLLGGVVAWLVRSGMERTRPHLILLAWFVIPLAGIMISPVRQDGVRYVMPCILALCVMAAAGYDAAAGWLRAKHAFRALAGAVTAYLAFTLARAAPYYLDYFNEATGGAGRVAADNTFETAWWGEGLDRAVDYVNDHAAPNARVYRDCIEPAHLAWFREDLWPTMTRQAANAEWIVVYAPATRRCPLPADAREVYQVVHDGVTLAVVYRRGNER